MRGRRGFWLLALLWLPAGVLASAALRFGTNVWPAAEPVMLMTAVPMMMASLAPFGLPLALGCRWLWRLGYTRSAWSAGFGLGVVTVAASLVAGLLGPIAMAVYALFLSLPVWAVCWWLSRRG